jgi:hypothetical protein
MNRVRSIRPSSRKATARLFCRGCPSLLVLATLDKAKKELALLHQETAA